MAKHIMKWRVTVVVRILAIASSTIHETMADGQRGRVIHNLDCTKYFMGTFDPIVPETK